MRNNFEHFDERIDEWWEKSTSHLFTDMNFDSGHPSFIPPGDKRVSFRTFDITTWTAYFWDEKFNIRAIVDEVLRIHPKLVELAGKPLAP